MNGLQKRILQISKDLGLTHVGSCLSTLPILEEIYKKKRTQDKVILDNAHSHLSHLLVMGKTEEMIKQYGIHCDRQAGCDASGGSLGHGLGIAIGMAIANPNIKIHVIVSDGSMMEGSNWEAIRLKFNLVVTNLKIYCNFNGFSAVAPVNTEKLEWQMRTFCPDLKVYYTKNGLGENKVEDHYVKL